MSEFQQKKLRLSKDQHLEKSSIMTADIEEDSFREHRISSLSPDHCAFLQNVRNHSISVRDAQVYVELYPESLETVDLESNMSVIQIAGDNRDAEMFKMLMEHLIRVKIIGIQFDINLTNCQHDVINA